MVQNYLITLNNEELLLNTNIMHRIISENTNVKFLDAKEMTTSNDFLTKILSCTAPDDYDFSNLTDYCGEQLPGTKEYMWVQLNDYFKALTEHQWEQELNNLYIVIYNYEDLLSKWCYKDHVYSQHDIITLLESCISYHEMYENYSLDIILTDKYIDKQIIQQQLDDLETDPSIGYINPHINKHLLQPSSLVRYQDKKYTIVQLLKHNKYLLQELENDANYQIILEKQISEVLQINTNPTSGACPFL